MNAVAPSLILTDMLPGGLERATKRIPIGRVGRPELHRLAGELDFIQALYALADMAVIRCHVRFRSYPGHRSFAPSRRL